MNVSSNNLLIKPQKWNKSIPEDVARFLLINDGLSEAMIGGYLGERYVVMVNSHPFQPYRLPVFLFAIRGMLS